MDENIANGVKEIQRLTPSVLGRLIYHTIRPRYDVIKINVDLVFKDALSPELKKKFIQLIYSHLARFLGEFLTLPLAPKATILKNITIKPSAEINSLLLTLKNNESIVLLGGHCGNFHRLLLKPINGFQNIQIGRKQRNIVFNTILTHIQKKYHLIMENNPPHLIFKLLPKGRQTLFLAIDNGATSSKGKGVIVNFFGIPAYTYTLATTLSQHPHIRPFFATLFRNTQKKHVLDIQTEINKDLLKQLKTKQAIMQYYYQLLEKTIMEHPEQWLGWALKKWQIDNPGRYKKQA